MKIGGALGRSLGSMEGRGLQSPRGLVSLGVGLRYGMRERWLLE